MTEPTDTDEDLAIVTPDAAARWAVWIFLGTLLAAIFGAVALFHLIASIY